MHPKHWETEEELSEEVTHIEIEIADSEVMAELKEWLDSQSTPQERRMTMNDSVAIKW